MKRYCLACVVLMACLSSLAQEKDPMLLRIEARGDYGREYVDGETDREASGFKGKYLNVIFKGEFAEKFSYAYRQRLNKAAFSSSFFDATDWLYLDYRPIPGMTLSAGKQVVGIGGYEYDRAPIDLYFCSEYWNNIACYQWGVSVAYDFGADNPLRTAKRSDRLLFQVCQSPFSGARNPYTGASISDLYAYNLMWYGSHGVWSTIWSANMIEYGAGRFIGYLSLGNELRLGRQAWLQFDFMNRAGRGQRWFFDDFSVIGELNWMPCQQLRVYGKASYDKNTTTNGADFCVHGGTDMTRVGCGLELWPLKNEWHERVRLHANYSYSWGANGNPNGALRDRGQWFNIGLTCRFDAINRKKAETE